MMLQPLDSIKVQVYKSLMEDLGNYEGSMYGRLTGFKYIGKVAQFPRNIGEHSEISTRQIQYAIIISVLKFLVDGTLLGHPYWRTHSHSLNTYTTPVTT